MDIIIAVAGSLVLAQLIDGRIAFLIAGIAVAGYRLWHRARRANDLSRFGLSAEQAESVQEKLRQGDQEGALTEITSIQEKERARLAALGVDARAFVAKIGRDIPWTDIVRHVFRVLDFDRTDTTMENGHVKRTGLKPYGYLLVESPILNQLARLPIVHRDDFWLADSVYDEPKLMELLEDEAELLVTYVPKDKLPGGLAGITHALHYVIVPTHTLERYYDFENDEHMRKPAPEKLFGEFVFQGTIGVRINQNPKL